jgi:predicted O-linked N-acetylglucosamine transferase (SPINDLY family)
MEHGDIDIMLDTFPFTGGMTSLNALWMGVPIITLAGTTPISRQTKTFLDLLGLHELVTTNLDEYIEAAVKLSFDLEKLQLFRDSLRQALLTSPLCDVKRFAGDVETLLFKLWNQDKRDVDHITQYAQLCTQQGNYARERNNLLTAKKLLKKAIALDNSNFVAYNSLGLVFSSLGKLNNAFECLDKALEMEDRYAEAWNNKASLQMVSGDISEAYKSYDKAFLLQPERLHIRSNQLLFMNYFPSVTQEECYNTSIMWKQYIGWQARACDCNNLFPSSSTKPKKLRIGFVSPDFRKHSVAYFLGALFRHLDKKKYEIICFSDVVKKDQMTGYLQSYADEWHEIFGVSHQDLHAFISNKHIHILFDLAGHTSRNRLEVFAAKPSPIQVAWLGYPNTTGLKEIDYRFTDNIADPVENNDKWYTEKLIRLSEGFLCYEPPEEAPPVSDFACLTKGYITFGSFNNISKISSDVVETWASIIARVEGSVLMLKNWFFSDQAVKDTFYDGFARFGISSDRIVLLPATYRLKDHLSMYQHIDIALDTFPYNGTTTTCEALWMGVPVVTFAGNRHAGRVGASILHRIGLRELVAKDRNDYIECAVVLAKNVCQRTVFRQSIREQFIGSSLFNGELFTRSFEDALDKIWSDYECSK